MQPNRFLSIAIYMLVGSVALTALIANQHKPPAAATGTAAPAPPLAPIAINPIHEGDTTVTGTCPLTKMALTLLVNGSPSPAQQICQGAYSFPIPAATPLKADNFVEVRGKSGDTKLSQSTTVLPPAVKLSKPVITATVGGKSIVAARNSADAAVAGLKVSVTVKTDSPIVCTPDDTSGNCPITLTRVLMPGDTIQAHETVGPTNGPDAILTLAPPTLSKPTVAAANEGDVSIGVTADKGDFGQTGLLIKVAIKPDGTVNSCAPDSTTGQCTVQVAPLQATQTIEAHEAIDDLSIDGPKIEAHIAPMAALGKPTISPVNEGDATVTVTLNSNDKGPDLSVDVLLCGSAHGLPACLPASGKVSGPQLPGVPLTKDVNYYSCVSNDATNSCPITLNLTVIAGDTVQAWEMYRQHRRPNDAFATVTVGSRTALGMPIVSPVKEADTSVKITLNSDDIQKWGTNLTVHASLFSAGSTIATKTCSPSGNQDNCSVTFDNPLVAGQVLHAYVAATPPTPGTETGSQAQPTLNLPSKPGPEVLVNVPELGFDWGRVRAYFSLGAVFSRSTTTSGTTTITNLSSPDIFAGLDMDFTWYTKQSCLAFPFGDDHVKLATLAEAAAQCSGRGAGKAPGGRGLLQKRKPSGRQKDSDTASQKSTPGTSSDAKPPSQGPSPTGATEGQAKPADNPGSPTGQSAPSNSSGASTPSVAQGALPDVICRNSIGKSPAAAFVKDSALATALEFLECIPENVLPTRLNDLKRELQDAGEKLEASTSAHLNAPGPLSSDDRIPMAKLAYALNKLATFDLTPNESQLILEQFGYESTPLKGWMLNSYVSTRLTQTQASNGFTLSNSPNSVHLEGGAYLPFYTSWSRWPYKGQPYALFGAPIAKLGFDSLRQSGTDPIFVQAQESSTNLTLAQANYDNAVNALSKDVFRMMAFGSRLGLFQLSATPNRAPETIMYIDFTYGRYDNFFTQQYSTNPAMPATGVRFPWRFAMNTRFQIPGTILYIGSDLTKGVGPDSLSIYVGARADLSALLGKLIPTTGSGQ